MENVPESAGSIEDLRDAYERMLIEIGYMRMDPNVDEQKLNDAEDKWREISEKMQKILEPHAEPIEADDSGEAPHLAPEISESLSDKEELLKQLKERRERAGS